jgi:hypothetical protein
MGLQIEASSEFRIVDALFWFELDDDHMLWFTIENDELVSRTYTKSGVQVGQSTVFITGLSTVNERVVFVQPLENGNFLINYRDNTFVDPSNGIYDAATHYSLYMPRAISFTRKRRRSLTTSFRAKTAISI